ncbi:phospholipase D family protein [Gallaecimonas kandeliae]|uniref:phospholipase D family protein n=1 Tax=Gallaecimonas kandeliae TaxID=3029055 RepID=UPI0026490BF0|nr:phospholipase D family protein [Gallaecimonas kandeliae]WKE65527.1 phospholipase D family protein [Gallaecimonas kandeliae]
MSSARWWLTTLSLLVAGAVNRVPRFAREPSRLLPPLPHKPWQARLGLGVRLLADNKEALAVRLALIEAASSSIDAQYYQWRVDTSGKLLLAALLDAADRGVRVRLLIDDIHTDDDPLIARLNAHANIQIRLFNPFGSRVLTPITRPLEWLWDFSRANHRMHNKALVVDGEVVVLGGRNVGDEYFGLHPRRNFLDLDLLAVGEVALEVGQAFDLFYNSQWAVPVTRLIALRPLRIEARMAFRKLHDFWDKPQCQALLRSLPKGVLDKPLLPGTMQVLFDQPSKIHPLRRKRRRGGSHTALVLARLARETSSDLLVVSPYLVPSAEIIALMGVLCGRGVQNRILTNSLAANDVVLAHTGYAAQRQAMLSAGVGLYELAPDAELPGGKEAGSSSSLHAKLILYDRRRLYLGTFNLDPRSIFINTEMGLLLDSPELVSALEDWVQGYLGGEQSWQPDFSGTRLLWRRCQEQSVWSSSVEPQASLWRRALARVLSWLPVRSQL